MPSESLPPASEGRALASDCEGAPQWGREATLAEREMFAGFG